MHPPRRAELLLALFGIAVVPALLLLAEGALALAGRAGLSDQTSSGIDLLHRYSEVFGWELRPGAHLEYEGTVVTINADGYRGRLLPREREADKERIVILGDSIAFGLDVSDGETYASLLDSRPNGLEVVNLAVQGYDPGQSLLRLERVGMAYHPDVVILAFCVSNDFADGMLRTFLYDGVHPKPYFAVEQGQLVVHDEHLKLKAATRAAFWLQDRSRLYRLLTAPARPAAGPQAEGLWLGRRKEALRDRAAAIEITFRIIARMREVAAARGAAFLVVLHPDAEAARGQSAWVEAFEHAPLLEGIPVVDLGKRYAARHLAFTRVARDEIGHLSPGGHQKTAQILEQALAAQGLLPYRAAEVMGTPSLPPR